jgi:hypothetical protein
MTAEVIEMPSTQHNEVNPTVKPKNNIMDSAVILTVSRRWPSLSKTVSSSEIQVNANKKRIHVSKDLFNSQALKKLFNFDAKIDEFLSRRCIPFPLKRAMYMLPIDLFNETENELTQHQAGRLPLIENCFNAYEHDLEEAKASLGDLFDPNDYLTKEAYRASFYFSWQYVQFSVDAKLKEISAEVAAREADKMVQKWVEAGNVAEQVLYSGMNELVGHLVERLSPAEEGKKKVFRDSMLDNLTDFLKVLKVRNLTGNENLDKLADQAKALINDVTPDMLRTNESMRAGVQAGFEQIKAELDKALVDAPMRAVRFED